VSAAPLTVFQILLIGLGILCAVLAATTRNDESNTYRMRLVAASLACWMVYALLSQIGGLVK
jgi:uncharacterized membrane protein YidH (DUF202 family)